MTYLQIQNRPQKRGKKPIKHAQYPKPLGATASSTLEMYLCTHKICSRFQFKSIPNTTLNKVRFHSQDSRGFMKLPLQDRKGLHC